MATIHTEATEVRQILSRLEERLIDEGDDAENIRNSFNNLICLLDSPLFVRLLHVEDSLHNLQRASQHCTFNDSDFEIDSNSGELLLLTGNKDFGHRSAVVNGHGASPSHSPRDPVLVARNVSTISKQSISSISGLPSLPGIDIESITLDKPAGVGNGLGFGIVCLRSDSEEFGVYVQGIQPGGVAALDGRLCENDRILAINDQLLSESSSLKQAFELLKTATGRVELVVAHGTVPETPRTTVEGSLSPVSPHAGEFQFDSDLIQVEVIDLVNDGSGLGFGIISGRGIGVIIKTILPGGVSDRDGRLKSGDRILQIGSIDVRGMSTEDVATVLRNCGINVRLIVARGVSHRPEIQDPFVPVIPVSQLDDELAKINRNLPMDYSAYTMSTSDVDLSELDPRQYATISSGVFSPTDLSSPPIQVFEVVLVKDQNGLGITIAGYTNPADGTPRIFINSITDGSVAALDGRIQVNDQIIAVDNQSLEGFNNQQAVDVLRGTGQTVCLKIARYQPGAQFEPLPRRPISEAAVRSSVALTAESVYANEHGNESLSDSVIPTDDFTHYWQAIVGENYEIVVADAYKFVANGGLGIGLEGTVTDDGSKKTMHHVIHSILPDGPVGITGVVRPGDELLAVNDIQLLGISHSDVKNVIQELPQHVRLICARPLTLPSSLTGTMYGLTAVGMLTPSGERLVKAKSEQFLANVPDTSSLSRMKSKSLEPLSKFGMWSSEPVEIELMKGDKGLGFSILDDPDTMNEGKTMIIIRSLVPGGMAQADGRLEPGDRLIAVNGINLFNASLDEAVRALSSVPRGIVRLCVLKPEHFGETSTDADQIISEFNQSPPPTSNASFAEVETNVKTFEFDSEIVKMENVYTSPAKRLSKYAPVADLSNDESFQVPSLSPLQMSPLLLHTPPGPPPLPPTAAPPVAKVSPQSAKMVSTWGPPHIVELTRKEGESLGISIVGGGNTEASSPSDPLKALSGIFIKHIKPDSPAGRSGILLTGDHVLEVNGVDVRDANHDQAVDVIRNAASPVKFLVESLISPVGMSSKTVKSDVRPSERPSVRAAAYSSSDDESETPEWNNEGVEPEQWDKLRMQYDDLDGELHVVQLMKGESGGLGMDLAGNRHLDTMSVFVARIHPDSPVARDGRIRIGDELLEVNEHVLYGRSHLNASAIIKSLTVSNITIVLLRRADFKSHIAVVPSYSFTPKIEDSNALIGSNGILSPENDMIADDQSDRSVPFSDSAPPSEQIQSPLDVDSFENVTYFCLQKSDRGFGFAIEELMVDDDRTGIFVKTVTPDGPAARNGNLSVGDRLLMVEEMSLVGVNYEQALTILRNIEVGASVQLTVSKNYASTTDEEADLNVSTGDVQCPLSPELERTVPQVVIGSAAISNHAASSESTISAPPSQHSSPKRRLSATPPAAADVADRRLSIPPPMSPPPVIPVIQEDPLTCAITPGQETTIEINKGKSGLGLSIVGGSDTLLGGVVVHEVYANGAAARDGRIMAGDQILEVSGVSLRDVTHDRAIQVMRQAPAVIRLVVLREDGEPPSDEEIYDTLTVDLVKKPGRGLGFSIVGRQDSSGVYIADIMKGSVAENDGRLMPADRIIGLNGRDVQDFTQEQVADLLKTSMGAVSIIVRRLKTGSLPPAVRRRVSSLSDQSGGSTPVSGIPKSFSNMSNISATSSTGEAQWSSGGLTLTRHDGTVLIVELTRQERGLLKMQLTPDVSTTGGPGPLVITDLFDTAGAIADKLQVYDRITSINGHLTDGMSETEALRHIQASTDNVIFTVVRDVTHALSESGSEPMSPTHGLQTSLLHDLSNSHLPLAYSESVRKIILRRGPSGFGFAIVGGYGSEKGDFPIIIKSVFPDGSAAVDGRLKRGDQLLSVDGQSLEGATHDQAVKLLKQAGDRVTLTVLS